MLSAPDVMVILVIALVVFGPKKLPEMGRAIGNAMREFKKASEEMRESFDEEIKKVEEARSHSTSIAPLADLPVKTSEPLALPGRMGEGSLPKTESLSEKA